MAKNREIEVKIKIADAADLKARLRAVGARRIRAVFEEDVLFDTREEAFRKREAILRLRRDVPVNRIRTARKSQSTKKGSQGGILTFKGLVREDPGHERKYKEREEIEFRIRDARRFEAVLRHIGMRPWFRYEKYRSEYISRRFPGLKLDVDETPVGLFLELEGHKRQIQRAARALGYSSAEFITASYLELYAAECGRKHIKAGNMTFRTQKKCEFAHSTLDKICECS